MRAGLWDRPGPSRTIVAFLPALSGPLYRIGGGSRIRTCEARSAADLQSAAINHSAIPPQDASRCYTGRVSMEPRRGLEPLTYRLQIGCAAICATRARVKCPRRDSTQKRSARADQVLSMRLPLLNGNTSHYARFGGENHRLTTDELPAHTANHPRIRRGGPVGPPLLEHYFSVRQRGL